jgi:hypothetical protein
MAKVYKHLRHGCLCQSTPTTSHRRYTCMREAAFIQNRLHLTPGSVNIQRMVVNHRVVQYTPTALVPCRVW